MIPKNLQFMIVISPFIFLIIRYFLEPYLEDPIQASSWKDSDCRDYLDSIFLSEWCFSTKDVLFNLQHHRKNTLPIRDGRGAIIYEPTPEEWDSIYEEYRIAIIEHWCKSVIDFCTLSEVILDAGNFIQCLKYQDQLLSICSVLKVDPSSVKYNGDNTLPFKILQCHVKLNSVKTKLLHYLIDSPVSGSYYSMEVVKTLDKERNYSQQANEYRKLFYQQDKQLNPRIYNT